ncbi:hypothetical protein MMC07_008397 [Pseudocyphellaria aurata]|nr:hypothetical protein [Pseudocyphellaria aurata]
MSSEQPHAAFTAAMETHSFPGILLDLDGTIVNSTDAIVKHWHELAKELGVDPNVILASSHGRRSIDTLQMYDPSKANWQYVSHVEGLIPQQYGRDAVEIPGAKDLLASLEASAARWAIVTSGTLALATGWLDVMKLSRPNLLVTAEDVTKGKPDPECYRLGKDRLDLTDQTALVVEDSPAGVRAGSQAGCKVIGLATTHDIAQLKSAGADWIVQDLSSVRLAGIDQASGQMRIEIRNSLRY